jgi:MerR family regulatory protein
VVMGYSMVQPRSVPKGTRTARAVPVGCSIGQAAEESGVSAKMIRCHESIGLVRPALRSAANYRGYDRAAIQTLRFSAEADYKRRCHNG